ncbi:MAG: DUF2520 domain-containing protein [Planctomycetota bacterium]|nr:DUF2520 domain-containing protein [Planctomycetota bacterium]
MSTSLTKIAVLGSGAMARALAHALQEAPCEVLLWARDSSVLGSGACASLGDVAGADVALMAISDSGIDDLAGRLVEEGCMPAVVLHTSGFHGALPLKALADAGCAVGGLHPLVSVPAGGAEAAARHLRGATVSVFGDPAALDVARQVVELLGARPIEVLEDQRPLYHAAAALAANGLVALFELALANGADALAPGSTAEDLGRGLAHLGQGVLANVAALGSEAALTGPVARGDAEVLAGHLSALEPEARKAYRALLTPLLELARKQGATDAALAPIRALSEE